MEQASLAVRSTHPAVGHFSEGPTGGIPLPGGVWVSGLQGSRAAGGAAVHVLRQEGGGLSVCGSRQPGRRFRMLRACEGKQCACSYGGAQLYTVPLVCVCEDGNCIVLGFATERCLEIC